MTIPDYLTNVMRRPDTPPGIHPLPDALKPTDDAPPSPPAPPTTTGRKGRSGRKRTYRCPVPGCPDLRYVTSGGRRSSYCRHHEKAKALDRQRKRYARRKRGA